MHYNKLALNIHKLAVKNFLKKNKNDLDNAKNYLLNTINDLKKTFTNPTSKELDNVKELEEYIKLFGKEK